MLHSRSHLLMTAISLECGYPASSLRERVYGVEGHYRYPISGAGALLDSRIRPRVQADVTEALRRRRVAVGHRLGAALR
jgi:hypothetical protein